MGLNHNTLCRSADFEHLAAYIEALTGAPYVPGQEHRKSWEMAMTTRAILRLLETAPAPRFLAVGAGQEATIFYLTNFGEVHATDLYAGAGEWASTAPPRMLIDPAACAPAGLDWQPRNLIVQHMNGRDLRYPDGSFDAVFSTSSIEHFSDEPGVIGLAVREMARVVRPGGLLCLSTELKLNDATGTGWPGVYLFDPKTLQRHVVKASGLSPVDGLDLTRYTPDLEHPSSLRDAVYRHQTGLPQILPHVVVSHQDYLFTSVHLTLRKPA